MPKAKLRNRKIIEKIFEKLKSKTSDNLPNSLFNRLIIQDVSLTEDSEENLEYFCDQLLILAKGEPKKEEKTHSDFQSALLSLQLMTSIPREKPRQLVAPTSSLDQALDTIIPREKLRQLVTPTSSLDQALDQFILRCGKELAVWTAEDTISIHHFEEARKIFEEKTKGLPATEKSQLAEILSKKASEAKGLTPPDPTTPHITALYQAADEILRIAQQNFEQVNKGLDEKVNNAINVFDEKYRNMMAADSPDFLFPRSSALEFAKSLSTEEKKYYLESLARMSPDQPKPKPLPTDHPNKIDLFVNKLHINLHEIIEKAKEPAIKNLEEAAQIAIKKIFEGYQPISEDQEKKVIEIIRNLVESAKSFEVSNTNIALISYALQNISVTDNRAYFNLELGDLSHYEQDFLTNFLLNINEQLALAKKNKEEAEFKIHAQEEKANTILNDAVNDVIQDAREQLTKLGFHHDQFNEQLSDLTYALLNSSLESKNPGVNNLTPTEKERLAAFLKTRNQGKLPDSEAQYYQSLSPVSFRKLQSVVVNFYRGKNAILEQARAFHARKRKATPRPRERKEEKTPERELAILAHEKIKIFGTDFKPGTNPFEGVVASFLQEIKKSNLSPTELATITKQINQGFLSRAEENHPLVKAFYKHLTEINEARGKLADEVERLVIPLELKLPLRNALMQNAGVRLSQSDIIIIIEELKKLTPEELKKLTPEELKKLTPEELKKLTPEELTPDELNNYPNTIANLVLQRAASIRLQKKMDNIIFPKIEEKLRELKQEHFLHELKEFFSKATARLTAGEKFFLAKTFPDIDINDPDYESKLEEGHPFAIEFYSRLESIIKLSEALAPREISDHDPEFKNLKEARDALLRDDRIKSLRPETKAALAEYIRQNAPLPAHRAYDSVRPAVEAFYKAKEAILERAHVSADEELKNAALKYIDNLRALHLKEGVVIDELEFKMAAEEFVNNINRNKYILPPIGILPGRTLIDRTITPKEKLELANALKAGRKKYPFHDTVKESLENRMIELFKKANAQALRPVEEIKRMVDRMASAPPKAPRPGKPYDRYLLAFFKKELTSKTQWFKYENVDLLETKEMKQVRQFLYREFLDSLTELKLSEAQMKTIADVLKKHIRTGQPLRPDSFMNTWNVIGMALSNTIYSKVGELRKKINLALAEPAQSIMEKQIQRISREKAKREYPRDNKIQEQFLKAGEDLRNAMTGLGLPPHHQVALLSWIAQEKIPTSAAELKLLPHDLTSSPGFHNVQAALTRYTQTLSEFRRARSSLLEAEEEKAKEIAITELSKALMDITAPIIQAIGSKKLEEHDQHPKEAIDTLVECLEDDLDLTSAQIDAITAFIKQNADYSKIPPAITTLPGFRSPKDDEKLLEINTAISTFYKDIQKMMEQASELNEQKRGGISPLPIVEGETQLLPDDDEPGSSTAEEGSSVTRPKGEPVPYSDMLDEGATRAEGVPPDTFHDGATPEGLPVKATFAAVPRAPLLGFAFGRTARPSATPPILAPTTHLITPEFADKELKDAVEKWIQEYKDMLPPDLSDGDRKQYQELLEQQQQYLLHLASLSRTKKGFGLSPSEKITLAIIINQRAVSLPLPSDPHLASQLRGLNSIYSFFNKQLNSIVNNAANKDLNDAIDLWIRRDIRDIPDELENKESFEMRMGTIWNDFSAKAGLKDLTPEAKSNLASYLRYLYFQGGSIPSDTLPIKGVTPAQRQKIIDALPALHTAYYKTIEDAYDAIAKQANHYIEERRLRLLRINAIYSTVGHTHEFQGYYDKVQRYHQELLDAQRYFNQPPAANIEAKKWHEAKKNLEETIEQAANLIEQMKKKQGWLKEAKGGYMKGKKVIPSCADRVEVIRVADTTKWLEAASAHKYRASDPPPKPGLAGLSNNAPDEKDLDHWTENIDSHHVRISSLTDMEDKSKNLAQFVERIDPKGKLVLDNFDIDPNLMDGNILTGILYHICPDAKEKEVDIRALGHAIANYLDQHKRECKGASDKKSIEAFLKTSAGKELAKKIGVNTDIIGFSISDLAEVLANNYKDHVNSPEYQDKLDTIVLSNLISFIGITRDITSEPFRITHAFSLEAAKRYVVAIKWWNENNPDQAIQILDDSGHNVMQKFKPNEIAIEARKLDKRLVEVAIVQVEEEKSNPLYKNPLSKLVSKFPNLMKRAKTPGEKLWVAALPRAGFIDKTIKSRPPAGTPPAPKSAGRARR